MEDMDLPDAVFGLPSNNDLVHQAYVAIASNMRKVLAHTKDRGERQGTGKKPWKQKGTGRARAGSVRSPLWRKGGIVFGPLKERNFKKKINKKMNRKAVLIALSEKVRSDKLIIVDQIKLAHKKTNDFCKALENLKVKGSILIGFSDKEKELRLYSRNIEKVDNILTDSLNVYDILNHKYLLFSKDSVKYLEEKNSK